MKHFLPSICISAAILLLAFAIKYPTLVFPMLFLMVIGYALIIDDVYFTQHNMKKIKHEMKEENDND